MPIGSELEQIFAGTVACRYLAPREKRPGARGHGSRLFALFSRQACVTAPRDKMVLPNPIRTPLLLTTALLALPASAWAQEEPRETESDIVVTE
jgi:hypothetical protein